jgi:molecular chaperone HscA
LNENEISTINNAISALAKIATSMVADDIEAAIETLNESTAIFAERRMDSSIKTALAGHSVDEV